MPCFWDHSAIGSRRNTRCALPRPSVYSLPGDTSGAPPVAKRERLPLRLPPFETVHPRPRPTRRLKTANYGRPQDVAMDCDAAAPGRSGGGRLFVLVFHAQRRAAPRENLRIRRQKAPERPVGNRPRLVLGTQSPSAERAAFGKGA